MKIGIFTALFGDKSREDALDIIKEEGIQAVEFGAGAYPGSPHLGGSDEAVEKLLESKSERDKLIHDVESRGLMISAISCHGNPIHPVKKIAQEHHRGFVNSVKLASALGVPVVNGFSGCPEIALTRSTPTGSPAPGRTSTATSSNINGKRWSFPTGPSRPSC